MIDSLTQIIALCDAQQKSIWEVILDNEEKETGKSAQSIMKDMAGMYTAMKKSNEEYDSSCKSNSGLVGGEGEKLRIRREKGDLISGDFVGRVMEKALRVAESNACMKRIVAAPTAGSCGVIPAVFLTAQEVLGISDEVMTQALLVAAGIGGVIAARASLSGAEGGCQAEIGAASAMAAGGLTYIYGGDNQQICNASALALKNLLGLACDPVAGLVEVPCVKRNVCGAVNAVTSADLSLAGIMSRIPADEVFDAMKNISKTMSETIRETAKGGLAVTPTGLKCTK